MSCHSKRQRLVLSVKFLQIQKVATYCIYYSKLMQTDQPLVVSSTSDNSNHDNLWLSLESYCDTTPQKSTGIKAALKVKTSDVKETNDKISTQDKFTFSLE